VHVSVNQLKYLSLTNREKEAETRERSRDRRKRRRRDERSDALKNWSY